MTAAITVFACCFISLACVMGVLSHLFDDTLIQRVALGAMSIFALGIAWFVLRGGELTYSMHGLLGCVAIHCAEVMRKVWNRHRRGRTQPADDFGKTIVMRRP